MQWSANTEGRPGRAEGTRLGIKSGQSSARGDVGKSLITQMPRDPFVYLHLERTGETPCIL